ncbi:MAG: thioredoxin domain-containing protein [Candidatus Peregrinibacteria bacterium]
MTSLQWKEPHGSKAPPTQRTQSNFWFGVSMVFIGVIVGFSAGRFAGGGLTFANAVPAPAAQAPTAPAPAPAPDPETAINVVPVDLEKDHIRGSTTADIAVIEYSDFECPFCQRVHPTMKQLLEQNTGKIMWIFRHYPLSFHPKAEPAAIASECVNELGGNTAFWKFTDAVFDQQATFDPATIAKQIGINADAFDRCVSSGKYQSIVQEQLSQGSASGIQGTPGTIVLNLKTQENRIVSGAQPLANFQAAIDALLQ